MEKDQLTRKLAVILHADVVGSTALVQQDEALAHQRIQDAFQSLSESIDRYGGTAREIRGDALLAEFDRASDAVSSALAFQVDNIERNSALSDEIRPSLRIGISLGEVIVADHTIAGAGVALAQRLEQLAEGGKVVVQGSVSETVPTRLPFVFDSIGEHALKGFDQPVRAFAVSLKPEAPLPEPDTVASAEILESKAPIIPNEPSIAVLPFTNMSDDREQEYFSDGITEDIITALSKISGLLVIARNSTFIYKGQAVDIKQVGREQGVRYVLEGSVRKAGNRVRITAQLIDAETNQHIWAERYDRELGDIFALQDELTHKIVSELDVHLLDGEQARFWSSGTDNVEAWECMRLGRELLDSYRAEVVPEVMRLLKKALDLDPGYASAWSCMAGANFHIVEDARYSGEAREEAFRLTRECAEKAIECDPACASAYATLGLYYLNLKDFDQALANVGKAAEMAPNYASTIAISALVLNKAGHSKLAMDRIRRAMRLCPVYPMWFLLVLGQVYRVLRRHDEAIEAFREMIARDPDHLEGHIGLTDALVEAGRTDEAKRSAADVLRLNPAFSIDEYASNLAFRDPEEITRFADALRTAGLP